MLYLKLSEGNNKGIPLLPSLLFPGLKVCETVEFVNRFFYNQDYANDTVYVPQSRTIPVHDSKIDPQIPLLFCNHITNSEC